MELSDKASKKKRGFLICSITTAILLAALILIAVILRFTLFKPRDPIVVLYPVGLKTLSLKDLITAVNVTTAMVIGITNPNRARFRFRNATSVVLLHDDLVVGEVPIAGNEIPARTTVNVTTAAVLMASEMKKSAVGELATGRVNLTSKVTLYGKSSALGFVKVKTSVYTECHLTVWLNRTFSGSSWCWSKLKIH